MSAPIESLAFCRLACIRRMQNTAKKRMDSGESSRVLVVDPSPVMRVGVTHMLHGLSSHQVVGCCDGEEEALRYLQTVAADVILTEVVLSQGTGLGLLRAVREYERPPRVVFFSSFDESLFGLSIARAGGSGYVNKNEPGLQIVRAITQVQEGELAFSDRVRQQMLTLRRGSALRSRAALPGGLSPREFDVFRMMGQGFSTEEIAQQMNISPKTVGLHRYNINHKLGCRSSAELYRAAVLWSEAVLIRKDADVLTRAFLQVDSEEDDRDPPLAPVRPVEA